MTRPPSPSPVGSVPEPHGAASRDALVDAALHCFAHQGYDGTTIRDIAARAGRNSSLISHYFGGKEGLYEEVFRRALQVHRPFVQAAGHAPGNPEEAARALRELIRVLCSDFTVRPGSADPRRALGRKLVLGELREPRPRIVALLREHVSPWMRQFCDCLRILRPGLPELHGQFLGICIMGEMMAHTMLREIRPCDWGFEEPEPALAAELLIEFNLRALGIHDPGAPSFRGPEQLTR